VKAPGEYLAIVPVVGITSVFTPAGNRKKGYAKRMMSMMSKMISERKDGAFSVLYSDIGDTFYKENGGWEVADRSELVIPHNEDFNETSSLQMLILEEEVTMLTLDEAENTITADVELIKTEILGENDCTVIRLIPQHAELVWSVTRDRYHANHLKKEQREYVGAKVGSGDGWGYVLWYHDYDASILFVLRLREPSTDAGLMRLLRVLTKEATDSGLEHVTIWSPSTRLENVSGYVKSQRKFSLPAVLYPRQTHQIHWQKPEKLGWC
jgi:hypothetical protein